MLKPALRQKPVKPPQSWRDLAHGRWLQHQVEEAIAPHAERLYGYHFARLGALSAELTLPKFPIAHQFAVAERPHHAVQVCALPTAWPFAEASLDAVLMVGQLEFAQDPHQILREVSHSLIAEGKLIYVGFNPYALNQLQMLWPGYLNQYPWCGRYFTKARVLDWLALLNFEVSVQHYFAPGLLQGRWNWPQRVAAQLNRALPQFNSCYLLVARKREFPLTLLPEKNKHRKLAPKLQTVPLANQTQSKESSC
ncbi:methyltransferase domain-containing protein [Pseudidiomarina insulisalsae]|uniref:Methyltransferase type 11 n=1 Tax=Pseudidiomarina insulisalsae TaxID=575789 RepID=A0A432YI30_9GAMM|nr:methyltransferase domain-containing protein [Pseudidiomarina insulisalsae]RUO60594.1 methyltransferase type 11 [Pseudidiomarina insulisalsae]